MVKNRLLSGCGLRYRKCSKDQIWSESSWCIRKLSLVVACILRWNPAVSVAQTTRFHFQFLGRHHFRFLMAGSVSSFSFCMPFARRLELETLFFTTKPVPSRRKEDHHRDIEANRAFASPLACAEMRRYRAKAPPVKVAFLRLVKY